MTPDTLSSDTRLSLYRELYRIRHAEEEIARLYSEQEMRCPTHLSVGQEACAVGACAPLERSDHVFSNHRCHAHYLAKGGDLAALFAELYGKVGGCGGGRGGSMHLIAPEQGMMGASAIVGSAIGLAVGSALAAKLSGERRVVVAFTGDAGPETGVFAEALNYGALLRLPLILFVENNLYATQTPIEQRQPNDRFYERGAGFGIPGERVDGQDVEAVYRATAAAAERARDGGGPSIIQGDTYRYLEHVGPNPDYELGYRGYEEYARWHRRDPLKRLAARVAHRSDELVAIRVGVENEVAAAIERAQASPFPDPASYAEHVFA